MVDASPLRQQRTLHLLPHRDRLHALRQPMLRHGRSVERALGSTGFLVGDGSTTTHHLEGIERRATRRHFAPTAPARTKVLMHEDNQAVVVVLSHLTSRSPAVMD
jgi:hypothetical protein